MSLFQTLDDNLLFTILEYMGYLRFILNMRSVNQRFKNTVEKYYKYFTPNVNFKITIPLLRRDSTAKQKSIQLNQHFLINNVKKFTIIISNSKQYTKSDYDLFVYPATLSRIRKFLKQTPHYFKDIEMCYEAPLTHSNFIYWVDKTIHQHYINSVKSVS